MLKRKVIAGPISNLTDARYFAAWMVDYISFDFFDDISKEEIEQYKEIIDWVEGPIILADISKLSTISLIFELKEKLNIKGFISKDIEVLNQLKSYSQYLFLKTDRPNDDNDFYLISTMEICEQYPERSFIDNQSLDTSKLVSISASIGLELIGGEEQEVGLKSFEELDSIFEILED